MTTDNSDPIVMPHAPQRRSTRFILFAGVAGACALGVGAGLWARPAMSERQSVAAARHAEEAAPAPGPARQLQIVVDDRIPPPAPAAPIAAQPKAEVAPPEAARQKLEPALELPPEEPQLPKRAPEGLMRILGPAFAAGAEKLTHPHFAAPPTVPEEPALRPAARHVAVRSAPAHAPSAEAIRLAKTQAGAERQARIEARLEAKREAQRAAKAQKIELARAQAAQRQAEAEAQLHAQIQAQIQAKTEAKAAAHRTELAKAAAHRTELARQAKAKDEQVRLAKAEARGRAQALAEARQDTLAQAERAKQEQVRLASLVRSLVHDMRHKAKPEPAPAPAPVQTARLDHRHGHKARLEQAAARKAHAMPKLTQAAHRSAPRYEPAPPQPHASGLMRVSTRCASHDPGEAIVCGDPNLGAADKQLTRAYQGARAAGVPDAQLRQQQQRWLAARSSAAREAPWAVRDVYLARIAELNGQAREARPDGK